MSRRIQIIRRKFKEFWTDEPRPGDPPRWVHDTVVRIYGPGGRATSPDTDPDRLLLYIAQVITSQHVDERDWEINGRRPCETRDSKLESALTGDDGESYYRRPRTSLPAETIVLDAAEIVWRGKVVWRCRTGSVVFPCWRKEGYSDLTESEFLLTCAQHFSPQAMRAHYDNPDADFEVVDAAPPPPLPPTLRQWFYRHAGD